MPAVIITLVIVANADKRVNHDDNKPTRQRLVLPMNNVLTFKPERQQCDVDDQPPDVERQPIRRRPCSKLTT